MEAEWRLKVILISMTLFFHFIITNRCPHDWIDIEDNGCYKFGDETQPMNFFEVCTMHIGTY